MIYRVTPGTDYNVLLQNMKNQITGEEDVVELYSNGSKVSSGIVKTGMTLVRNSEENYDVSVLGDVTGDGLFDQRDLSGFIRHYIGLSEFVLTGKGELKSTDVNNDEDTNLVDISSMIAALITDGLPEDKRPDVDKPKAIGTITLSETNGEGETTEIGEDGVTITGEDSKTITITNPSSGEISATSSDDTVATVSIEDGVLIITPKKAGRAEITIKVEGTNEYTPATITIIIIIQKAEGSVTLNSTSGTTIYPNTKTVGITNPSGGALSVTSSDSTIATGSISGNTLTITPKKAGTATITVTSAATDLYTSSSATYTITVENSSDKLMLSETSGTTTYPNNKTVTITNPSGGTLSTTSSDSTVATASISGNTLTITPKKAGTATITVNSAAAAGYNASSATYTITVQKATGSVSLGATSGTTTYPNNKTTTITNPNGATLSTSSSDSSIATASISGNTLTITPKKSGTTTITVTAAATEQYTSATATYSITINKGTGSVTLGETSGTTTYPNNKTTTITNPNGATLSVSSSNSSIAIGSMSGNTLTISVVNVGTATITVTAAATEQYTSATATYSITINKGEGKVLKAPTAKTGLTCTKKEQTLINSGFSMTGIMYYKLEGGTYSTSLPKATDVGIYKVYYYSKGDTNYNDTEEEVIYASISEPPLLASQVEEGDDVIYYAAGEEYDNDYSYTSNESQNGYSSQTFTNDEYIEWIVFSKNTTTGEVVLISKKPIGELTLKGSAGFLNVEETLNRICSIYGHGKGANTRKTFTCTRGMSFNGYDMTETVTLTGSGARSINIDDINSKLGETLPMGAYWEHRRQIIFILASFSIYR
ncbi:MAG: hypothetical protein J6M60_01320 [Clostridia bacterium]|nr:hypothetical protein [Clostridia bacterium]